MEEIVSVLDAFNGQLSLSDVLNQELPLINLLREAKIGYSEKVQKEREKQQQNTARQSQQQQK